jgi:Domain of unknown function (DUF5666)
MGSTLRLALGIAILSLALTAIGQITTTAYGQEPEKPKPEKQKPEKPQPGETITINGKVSAIDDMSITVVDDQKATHTIAIDAKTKISKAGKDAKAADIKAEDAVVVEARKGEADVLTAITIKAA